MSGANPLDDGGRGPALRPTRGPDEIGRLLPEEVRALLARERLVPTLVEEVTAVPGGAGRRRTFRVEVAGGRVVKARVVTDEESTARMARWLPRLAARGFSPLLAVAGTATIEAWIDGPAAPPDDDATAFQAGALLGACHATLPLERISGEDARLADAAREEAAWLTEVEAAGHLDGDRAGRVRTALAVARPRAATWGLRHGDFHAVNLVVGEAGLCCVDNTSIAPGLVEIDLGFTFNRWPLRPSQRARFLAGYGRSADPGPFLASERGFRVAAALRSAAWRTRAGAGDVEVPLAELAGHVP